MARPVLPRTARITPTTSCDNAQSPQNGHLEYEPRYQQDDAESDHD